MVVTGGAGYLTADLNFTLSALGMLLAGGSPLWLRTGGFFLLEYYSRLFLLNRYNLLPFDLIPFLDHATELIFLQRIGGSYRFIHRTVQEFFAAQWVGQDSELGK